MALRQHRLPRVWLGLTLGSVAVIVIGVFWWERQLPSRIQQASSRGQLQECLRYSEQLTALSWLPGRTPQEQGRCRRLRALQLWQAGRWQEALLLQRQLVHSAAGRPGDRERLNSWRQTLREQALTRFRDGDLPAALRRLQPLGEEGGGAGDSLGDELRRIWQRNRLLLLRAERLTDQERWWEALDALHRIDHPWWRQRAAALRMRVQQGLSRLPREDREHEGHGSLPHTVDTAQLDIRVRRHIAAGMEEGQAFELACRQMGGRVVEAGPDSACQH